MLAGGACSPCPTSAKPINSHFVRPTYDANNCTFECDSAFSKSASNFCLTPIKILFQVQMSYDSFLALQNIYRFAFAAAGSSLVLDAQDIEFTQSIRRTNAISIIAKILVNSSKITAQIVEDSFAVSRINQHLPPNLDPILNIVSLDLDRLNVTANSSQIFVTGKSIQNTDIASGYKINFQTILGLAIGLPLGTCLLAFCVAAGIRHKFRASRQTKSLYVLPCSQEAAVSVESDENVAITTMDNSEIQHPFSNPLQITSNISNHILAQPLHDPQHQTPVKHSVRQIDFSEILVGNEISQGSFKSVYQAIWTKGGDSCPGEGANMTVAVLVLRQGGGMAREIEVFETLGCHPHLTRLLAVTTDPSGRQCLVTEFASRGSLDQVLHDLADRQREVSHLVLVTMCMQICDGMEVLSEHRLIHRDLAARNVLVFKFDECCRRDVLVKISDYGLTVEGSYVQLATSSVGEGVPVRWMPPEVRLA